MPTGLGVSEACLGAELHSVPGLGRNEVIVEQTRRTPCSRVSRVGSPVEEVNGRQCPVQGPTNGKADATESLQVKHIRKKHLRRGGAEHSPGSVTGMGQVLKSRAKWGIRNKSCSGNRL